MSHPVLGQHESEAVAYTTFSYDLAELTVTQQDPTPPFCFSLEIFHATFHLVSCRARQHGGPYKATQNSGSRDSKVAEP